MCGIVAVCANATVAEWQPTELNQLEPETKSMCERMMDRLAHRGPDDTGLRHVGQTWLGHRRLSIVDVNGGHQPLTDEDETRWIVGNGEIYNHLHLRESLSSHTFRTKSDNEVILHLIEEAGPSAIARMRGMFAFVVADSDGMLVAGRDPIGIKPLYWARQGQTVLFASEIKCFDEAWRPFVEEFPPGHYWTPEEGLVAYAKIPAPKSTPSLADPSDTPSEAVLSRIRETLTSAVERRMMADVPVGVFLSGGLDSSLIASLASQIANREGRQIHSFAVGLEGSPDLVAARKVADFLGTCHHERIYTPEEALQIVPDVIEMMESFDPSLVQSAVANYMLAELTAEHVKVVLTGEGSDELFAGYKYHKSIESNAELHQELVKSVGDLHHLNLQRCDRTTMAHGLEARVPFLDLDFISLALSLPVEWKLYGSEQTEKWILRLAFEGYLPNSVLWREKEQFNEGSGMQSVLRERLGDTVPEDEFAAERHVLTPPLATREEMAYFRLFQSRFRGVKIPNIAARSNVAFAI